MVEGPMIRVDREFKEWLDRVAQENGQISRTKASKIITRQHKELYFKKIEIRKIKLPRQR